MAKAKSKNDVVWKGNPELRPFLRPIAELMPDPSNARFHPERNLEGIGRSFARFGQQKVVVCRADGEMVAGSGTLVAASARLGWTHLAVVTTDLDDEDAEAFGVADNRTSDLSTFDPHALVKILERQVARDGVALEDLGFDDADFRRFLANVSPDPPDEFPPVDPNAMQFEHTCPRCTYQFNDEAPT